MTTPENTGEHLEKQTWKGRLLPLIPITLFIYALLNDPENFWKLQEEYRLPSKAQEASTQGKSKTRDAQQNNANDKHSDVLNTLINDIYQAMPDQREKIESLRRRLDDFERIHGNNRADQIQIKIMREILQDIERRSEKSRRDSEENIKIPHLFIG